jgi:hypothetical protein
LGTIRQPEPVKLFTGVLTSLTGRLPEVEDRLTGLFGPVDARSEMFPFDHTDYYDAEMGAPLFRVFWGFRDLVSQGELPRVKTETNTLEVDLAHTFGTVARPVNIDPGYLEQSKIVLASTKNFSHRIFLSDGIYAEVTMYFEDRRWRHFPWTFPDFRSGRYDEFFLQLRSAYRSQLGLKPGSTSR